jgi:diguanylate cyclase (GGDEF)-like protein/PAS domain S-box-containing protein
MSTEFPEGTEPADDTDYLSRLEGDDYLLHQVARLSGVGTWRLDVQAGALYWSEETRRIHRVPADFTPDLNTAIEFYAPEARPLIAGAVDAAITRGERFDLELRIRCYDGEARWVRAVGKADVDGDGRTAAVLGAFQDISEIKAREQQLEALHREAEGNRARLWQAIEALPDAFAVFGEDDRLLAWNTRYGEVYSRCGEALAEGAGYEALLRFGVAHGQFPAALEREDEWLESRLAFHRSPAQPIIELLPDGRYVQVHERRTGNGDLVVYALDVTSTRRRQRKLRTYASALERANARIESYARRDPLTGVANRRSLDEFLLAARAACAARTTGLAILHVDLDRFKEINDTLGHTAGDHVLRHVAEVLRGAVREDDLVARVGGDEFVVAIMVNGTLDRVRTLADRLIVRLQEPVTVGGNECRFGASIGIAYGFGAAVNPSRLIINADMALYRAKSLGRGRCEFFSPRVEEEFVSRKRRSDEVQLAVERSEFVPWYQLQFDARTMAVVGAEALARWQHPTRGIVNPGEFLEIAESLNLAKDIDAMVLSKAAADYARWQAAGVGLPRLSVNVSLRRLESPALLNEVRRLGLPPGALSVELVESIFFDDDTLAIERNVDRLREMGVDIEIDDFGSGHASVIGLTRLRPRRLKIDRQLVDPVTRSSSQRALVRAIVDMGRALDIEVLAEGIETLEHAHVLRELGCDSLQGFALARPVAAEGLADEIARLARELTPRAAAEAAGAR